MIFTKKIYKYSLTLISTVVAVLMMTTNSFAGVQDFLLDPFDKCEIKKHKTKVHEDFLVQYSTYEKNKRNEDAKKAILILPPTGGKNIIDKGYANLFCKAGYKVYILEEWTGLYEYNIDFKMHQKYQTRFQDAIAFMVNEIKEEKIGVLGASAGAINFSVTLGVPQVIKKVQAFIGVVSGGPLCKVIGSTREKDLENLRKERMKKFNIKTQEDYEQKICDNLKWDLAKEKPKHIKLGLITSNNDETVLTKYQNNQVKNLKPDFLIALDSSHRGTVIKSFLFYRGRIKDFFERNL